MTEKKGLFSRLREGLFKSREHMSVAMEAAVQDDRPIDEDFYDDLLDALILSDMGAPCATEAIDRLRERVRAERLRYAPQAKEALKGILVEMLEVEKPALHWPMVTLMVGVNGVGKTTTIGKLALRFQGLGRTIILCAADKEPLDGDLLAVADRMGVPVLATRQKSFVVFRVGSLLLHELTAPRASMHGTLVDVRGVGVLLEGPPGIGKSETALGLVRHGCALVADDVALLSLDAHGALWGTAPNHLRGFMEIRGLGLLHVPTLFGISAVRPECRMDLIVSLRRCTTEDDVDRVGSDVQTCEVLGLPVPRLLIPVAAGRDFVNVVETAAATFKMRGSGVDAAAVLDEQVVNYYQTVEQRHE